MVEIASVSILDNLGQPLNTATPARHAHTPRLFTEILGFRCPRLKVRFQLAGGGSGPETLSVQGLVRGAGQTRQAPRLRFRATARRQAGGRYEVDASLKAINGLMAKDDRKEFCTVVREHGTSADRFARRLATWENRGQGVQPDKGKASVTGDAAKEIPDARSLMLAGGVEVMEVWAAEADGANPNPLKTWAFLRSPADVVFYSGHGGWWNGALLRGTPFGHVYDDWLTPEDFLVEWRANPGKLIGTADIDLLVINGCSVLLWNLDPSTSQDSVTRKSQGLMWSRLLRRYGGPLAAICGYRHTAPIDDPFGNKVAETFASRLQKGLGPGEYAKAWLQINARNPATWTACAWDNLGYHYINYPTLNSHLSGQAPGTIVGPVPFEDATS